MPHPTPPKLPANLGTLQMQPMQALPSRPLTAYELGKRTRKFMWWYDSIIDWMLANPDKPIRKYAEEHGRTYQYILTITNSDSFKTRYLQRREEFNALHAEGITSRLNKVAVNALDIVIARLEEKKDVLPLKAATEVMESALSKLGYGQKVGGGAPGVTVQVNQSNAPQTIQVSGVTREELAAAQQALRNSETMRAMETARQRGVLPSAPLPPPAPSPSALPSLQDIEDL